MVTQSTQRMHSVLAGLFPENRSIPFIDPNFKFTGLSAPHFFSNLPKNWEMEENLADRRQSYEKSALGRENLTKAPMALFKRWFDEAEKGSAELENNAMTLATIDRNGFPKNRIVLLKKFNDEGFVFYTNYASEKGVSIAQNPKVSLSFFWPSLERQVIVKGKAELLPAEESDAYFAVRPRGSRLGAWASHQSEPIADRRILEDQLKALEERFADNKPIPRPDFWGGFLVRPCSIEFWQGRKNRLHDRFKYSLTDKKWTVSRLAP